MSSLVLLHGWGLTPAVWHALQAALPTQHCIALHCRPPAGSLADWADAISVEIPPGSVVLGWSLGAMLAMSLAARHPQRVAKLILIAATPRFVQSADWPHALDAATVSAFRQSFTAQPARTLSRFIALQAFGDEARSQVAAQLTAALADAQAEHAALAHGLRLLEESDLRSSLPSPSLPCLLIHGQADALMPPAAAEWLAQRWPLSQQLILPAVGHAPHLSCPARLAQVIESFLNAQPR